MKLNAKWLFSMKCGKFGLISRVLSIVFLGLIQCTYLLADEKVDNMKVSAQQEKLIDIRGKVLDETGNPAPGVNVSIKGLPKGGITDMDGNYFLKDVSSDAVLMISFIGYKQQEIQIQGRTIINVTLEPDVLLIDEVVVQVGYGSVKRANLLGAVADISTKEVEDVVTGNLSSALIGTMPGITIGETSGAPGASTSITIRTSGSWNNESPIFVIDGFVYEDQEAFDILDPSEVESISVLKDGAASVYGARAAGGVIVVTTKRGKEGKPKINYSGTYGISNATSFPKLMSAYDHAQAVNDLAWGQYNWDRDQYTENSDEKVIFNDSDLELIKDLNYSWLDKGWKPAAQTRHNVTVSGGTKKAQYFFGGSYMYQNGNFDNLDMNKYTMRTGVDIKFADSWSLKLGLDGNSKKTSMPYNAYDKEPEKMYITYSTLLRMPKWLPPYINGLPVGQGIAFSHPLYINDVNTYRKSESNNVHANMALEWEAPFIKGLTAKVSFDYSKSNSTGVLYAKPYDLYSFTNEAVSSPYLALAEGSEVSEITTIENGDKYSQSASFSSSYQLNFAINYSKTLGKHSVKALLVGEQSAGEGSSLSGTATKMIYSSVETSEAFGDGVADEFSGSPSFDTGGRQSLVGRLNYDFNDKYLVESSFRYEGSTKFAPEDRWGFFPSVSLGWRVSEEPFFKNNISSGFIDNMKIRLSYGLLGNDKGNALAWEENYEYSGDVVYLGGSTLLGGISPLNDGATLQGVSWEKTDSYNGGIELRLFEHLSFSYDMFYRYTYDILQQVTSALPYQSGISTQLPKSNYGIQKSWGDEISIKYDNNIGTNWKYYVKGNLGYATSRVVRKYQALATIGTWKDEEGRIRGGETGYVSLGIMSQSDVDQILTENPDYTIFGDVPEAGMLNFKDVGGSNYSNEPDGKVDENDERIISKYDSAPYTYGFSLGFEFKSFKFDAVFNGSFGNDIILDKAVYNKGQGNRSVFDWLSYRSNNLTMWKDHWTPDNTDAKLPRLDNGKASYRSTFWKRDGHVLNWRSVTLSYNMPKSISSRIGIPSLRIFCSGNNLLTIINPYKYRHPSLSSWMDYPIMRSFNFGVNLNL